MTTLTGSKLAQVLDVSTTGARLQQGDYLLDEGEELLLSIGGTRAFGTVMWTRDKECGVSFETPLTEQEVRDFQRVIVERRGLSPEMKVALDMWTHGSVT